MKKGILKKVSIREKIDNNSYIVEDIFSSEKLIMKLGKLGMNYIRILIGDTLYIVLPNEDSKEGKLVSEKYICLNAENSELCQQKRKIEILEKAKNNKIE